MQTNKPPSIAQGSGLRLLPEGVLVFGFQLHVVPKIKGPKYTQYSNPYYGNPRKGTPTSREPPYSHNARSWILLAMLKPWF